MRCFVAFALAALVTAGCGGGTSHSSPDAVSDTGNYPPPRIISGGGIGDGPIDGVVNLYVIDDATRLPIAGATVRVGGMDGTTDATGLFVAQGVAGPQEIAVRATGYRSELWLGANGANCTADLKAAVDPAITKANLSGSITGFDAIPVTPGHHKAAIVLYSQDDHATDAENNLPTANSTNICDTATASDGCAFTVTTRAGHVALFAAILDHDLNGTPLNPADDTYTVTGWAYHTGLVVQDGIDETGVALTMLPQNQLATVSASLAAPSLPNATGLVGLELGSDGVAYLAPAFITQTSSSALAPALAAFPSATYRLVAFANNGSSATAASAAILLRGQTGTTLTAPAWLPAPTNVALTRTGGSWDPVPGALVQTATYDSATDHLLSVTLFDDTASFTISDVVPLPTTGALTAKAGALGGTLDVTSFSIDDDLAKITAFVSQPQAIQ